MKRNKFYISDNELGKKEVDGYLVENHKYSPEVEIFVFKRIDKNMRSSWGLTELKTGRAVGYDFKTRKQAIENIDKLPVSKERFIQAVKDQTKKYGCVNPG